MTAARSPACHERVENPLRRRTSRSSSATRPRGRRDALRGLSGGPSGGNLSGTPDVKPEAQMSMAQCEGPHQSLVARIPEVTGRGLPTWPECLSDGPVRLRFEERVNWLADEH